MQSFEEYRNDLMPELYEEYKELEEAGKLKGFLSKAGGSAKKAAGAAGRGVKKGAGAVGRGAKKGAGAAKKGAGRAAGAAKKGAKASYGVAKKGAGKAAGVAKKGAGAAKASAGQAAAGAKRGAAFKKGDKAGADKSKSYKLGMRAGRGVGWSKKNPRKAAAIGAGTAAVATGAVLARRAVMKKKYPKMADSLRSKIMAAQKAGNHAEFYRAKIKLAKVSAAYGGADKGTERAKIRRYQDLARKSKKAGKLVMS